MSVVCAGGWVAWAGQHAVKTERRVNTIAGTGKWSRALLRWVTLISALGYLHICTAQSHNWVPLSASWGPMRGAVDQSALNSPLTPADTLAVVGRNFMTVGPDGVSGTPDDKRVRLFGINLGRDACFPPVSKAAGVATTLRSLGFNAVRLHQMDTTPSRSPEEFVSSLTSGPYPSMHAGAMERLRHFIQQLNANGIYVNVNLMVGYVFRPDIDGVPALDTNGTAPGYGSPVHVFYPQMVDKQVEYAQKLLGALNLRNEPALAQVEIINESSLAFAWLHWDKTYWEQQIKGEYARELSAQWNKWVGDKYGDMNAACQSWKSCESETKQMLTPAQADALQHTISTGWWLRLKQKFNAWLAQVWVAIGMPPRNSKIEIELHPKVRDTLEFVAETDKRFVEKMRAVVRAATRPNMPVTGTQIDFGAPLNFHSHGAMDYVDSHFYVDHPVFPGQAWSDSDWHFHNETVSGREMRHLLSLAAFRDVNRPFVVSEYNQPFPNTHGHDILPVTAAFAAQQDWDGLYFFAYAGTDDPQDSPGHFFLQGDWSKASVVGLAARIFRTGAVAPLQMAPTLQSQPEDWWRVAAHERRPDTWFRHLVQSQLFSEITLPAHQVAMGTANSSSAATSSPVTPQFRYWEDERRVSIESATLNAVLGEVPVSTPTTAGSLSVMLPQGDARSRTAALLHSLDGKSVNESRHLLLSTPTSVTGSVRGSSGEARPQGRIPYRSERSKWTLEPNLPDPQKPSAPRTTNLPLWLDRQPLTVDINTIHKSARVYPLTPRGERMTPLAPPHIRVTPSGIQLALNETQTATALWYELVLE